MKPSHSPLRTNPPNLDRLAKLESWTEQPLREALGEGARADEPAAAVVAPEVVAEPASAPENDAVDDLEWIAPPKKKPKQSYPLMLPADLHAKLKRLSEKTGESMNAMLTRAADREYERIIAALSKKKMTDDYPEGQGELWEELKVESSYFAIMNATIRRKLIAKIGRDAWAAYCVIKAYANFETGNAFPSQETIADLIGASVTSVQEYLNTLYKHGLVNKTKKGRNNHYAIVEAVPMLVGDEVVAYGERIYQPKHFQDFLNQLKEFGKHGDMPKDRTINITLNVQVINQGDNSTVNVNNISLTPEQLKAIQAVANKTRKIG